MGRDEIEGVLARVAELERRAGSPPQLHRSELDSGLRVRTRPEVWPLWLTGFVVLSAAVGAVWAAASQGPWWAVTAPGALLACALGHLVRSAHAERRQGQRLAAYLAAVATGEDEAIFARSTVDLTLPPADRLIPEES